MWLRYLIAVIILGVIAYLATTLFTGTIGYVIAVIAGLGALVCVILLVVDLIRGGTGTTRA